MTAADLKNRGYKVSSLISDTIIDRLEKEAVVAYIEPLKGSYEGTDAEMNAIASLVYFTLNSGNTFSTRSGGKEKLSPDLSEKGYSSDVDAQRCDFYLSKIQTVFGLRDKLVNDIFGIYFRTYLGFNR